MDCMPFAVRVLSLLLVPWGWSACGASLPSHLPAHGGWLVAVKSCALPDGAPWWKRWAHHAWVDVRNGDTGRWQRIESGGSLGIVQSELDEQEARLDRRFGGRIVRLLGWVENDAARAAATRIDAASDALAARYRDDYTVWPGPNSNTFVRELLADVPELGFVFDPNAIGKDYDGWLGAGLTASKTGVRLDTPLLGAAVGLHEGVELHLLQLTIGVSLVPPGLSLPFLPQIPWGWLGAPPARLEPPPIPDALQWRPDAAALDGERRALGELGAAGVVVVALEDGAAWLRLDGELGPPIAGTAARDWQYRVTHHDQDGVWGHGGTLRLEAPGPPAPLRLHCGDAVVHLDALGSPGGGVSIGVRGYRSIAHEAAAR